VINPKEKVAVCDYFECGVTYTTSELLNTANSPNAVDARAFSQMPIDVAPLHCLPIHNARLPLLMRGLDSLIIGDEASLAHPRPILRREFFVAQCLPVVVRKVYPFSAGRV
jgi:hypothetical protein